MMPWLILAGIAIFSVGVAFGIMWNDQILLGQEAAHKAQMAALFVELKRARTQVANLIGKE